MRGLLAISFLCFLFLQVAAQDLTVTVIDNATAAPLATVELRTATGKLIGKTNVNGKLTFPIAELNSQKIICLRAGFETYEFNANRKVSEKTIRLKRIERALPTFEKQGDREVPTGFLRPVEGTVIVNGMKSETITPALMGVDVGLSNSRQVYRSVPGLNIWENDGAGIQLAIGARGLSPNRTSHFNVRQDMHDISADALGYPESYYSPSLLSVERIEIIRGAAALQFGTQFGGLLNFKMKRAAKAEGHEFNIRQTGVSYGTSNQRAALANWATYADYGLKKKRVGLFAALNMKRGDGWRPNSGFELLNAYLNLNYAITEQLYVEAAVTHMDYLAQQPGGLTDAQFNTDALQSLRTRNWFAVNWNMATAAIRYEPNSVWSISTRFFGLSATRKSLGFLGQTQRPDPLEERDLIDGTFKNMGNETRILHRILKDEKIYVVSGGMRIYQGNNSAYQGLGNAASDANFTPNESVPSPSSNYRFPNNNVAFFAQAIIPITERISVSPGVRKEFISTSSAGSFRSLLYDGAGNIIEDTVLMDARKSTRDFQLFGVSLSYKTKAFEVYANASQNYRAINFSDIQIRNNSLEIDPNISDERGANYDLGIRTPKGNAFQLDFSLFLLDYKDRIGEFFTRDALNRAVRFRTNIADARTRGIELFAQQDFSSLLFSDSSKTKLSIFSNVSLIDGSYIATENSAFDNKKLELVPNFTIRTGLLLRRNHSGLSLQCSYTGKQFSDATNVGSNPDFPATLNAVDGIIPSYFIADIALDHSISKWCFRFSVNNFLDARYFTRRATGYPGPGIIPSDGRNYNLSIAFTLK